MKCLNCKTKETEYIDYSYCINCYYKYIKIDDKVPRFSKRDKVSLMQAGREEAKQKERDNWGF